MPATDGVVAHFRSLALAYRKYRRSRGSTRTDGLTPLPSHWVWELEGLESRVLLSATPIELLDTEPGSAIESIDGVKDTSTAESPSPLAALALHPFERLAPNGSLTYASDRNTGSIDTPGHTERFTFKIEAGQTISTVVKPNASLIPTIELRGPNQQVIGTASATVAGQRAALSPVIATTDGQYTLTIGGALETSGTYDMQVILNAIPEDIRSSDSDSQDLEIDSSFVSLGSGRYSAVGQSDPIEMTLRDEPNDTIGQALQSGIGPGGGTFSQLGRIGDHLDPSLVANPGLDVDMVRLDLDAGSHVTAYVETPFVNDAALRVFDAAGTPLVPEAASSAATTVDFTASVAGAYYVGVSGASNLDYDPSVVGSGSSSEYQGAYGITISVQPDPDTEANDVLTNTQADLILNGGFETGDFTGWTATTSDTPGVLTSWNVGPAGGGFFSDTSPLSGEFDAFNGFDGLAGFEYELYQDVSIPSDTQAKLTTNHRIVFDSLGISSSLDRMFEISIRDTNHALLEKLYTESVTLNNAPFTDLGWVTQSFDVSEFAGQTVRIHFRALIPESFKGPAHLELDDISLLVEQAGPNTLPDTDRYTVDLTGKSGHHIDILLAGLEGADFSTASLELLDTDGVTVVATAAPAPVTSSPANYDLGIFDYLIPADGRYTLRMTSELPGRYTVLLTDALTFDREPNDLPGQALRSLNDTNRALGFVEKNTGSSTPIALPQSLASTYPGVSITGPLPWSRTLDAIEPEPRIVVVDDPSLHEIAPGTGFDGVTDLSISTTAGNFACTGALLESGNHVLTAAHCVTDSSGNLNALSTTARFDLETGPVTLNVQDIFVHPDYDGSLLHGSDIAILQLDDFAPEEADPYDIYRDSDEVGQIGLRVGYGLTGTGDFGQGGFSGVKRGGENRYDALADIWNGHFFTGVTPGTQLGLDFDDGSSAHDAFGVVFDIDDLGQGLDEVLPAPGDSGGPVFIDGLIAGVTSYGFSPGVPPDVLAGTNASFGEFAGDTRVSIFADWIDNILSGSGLIGPTVTAVDPPAGQVNQTEVTDIHITFSEPILSSSATDANNYELRFAGANGVFETGSGDDQLLSITPVFDGLQNVTLTIDPADTPLVPGVYRLTIEGDASIEDLDGNPLNSTTGPGGGADHVHVFEIVSGVVAGGDLYQISVEALDTLVVSTRTPFDNLSTVSQNDLDPRIVIVDPSGMVVANDSDSSTDGKNADLRFVAPDAGVYTVQVLAESGSGEYVLDIDIEKPLRLVVEDVQVTGSASEVVSGFFDLSFDVPDELNPMLAAYNVQLTLNPQNPNLAFTDVTAPPDAVFGDQTPQILPSPDPGQVIRVADNLPAANAQNPIVDGDPLFRVHFEVQPGFVGDFQTDVDVTQVLLFDGLASPIVPVKIEPGTISVIDPPPTVIDVLAGGSAWNEAFLDQANPNNGPGYAIPVGGGIQLQPLPWVNIDQLHIRFSEDVTIDATDLSLPGVNVTNYKFVQFDYDAAAQQASWLLDLTTQPEGFRGIGADKLRIDLADTVHDAAGKALDGDWVNPADVTDLNGSVYPSGDGLAGGDFQFRFDVLPGNTDLGKVTPDVRPNDTKLVRKAQFLVAGDADYDIFLDVNGSGAILGNDVVLVRNRKSTALPTTEPAALLSVEPINDEDAIQPIAMAREFQISSSAEQRVPLSETSASNRRHRDARQQVIPVQGQAFSLVSLEHSVEQHDITDVRARRQPRRDLDRS